MNFANRLHTALFENVLVEMASFSLPKLIPLPNSNGEIVHIKYLDMRWEDYKNPLIARWGQWTPFTAKIPGHDKYLIWDGTKAWIGQYPVAEYYVAPKNWWVLAQGMDEKGNVIMRPKVRRLAEI